MKYSEMTGQLTLREQLSLLGGKDWWHTVAIPRLGIPNVMVSDGPTGLRKEIRLGKSIEAVCYPSATAVASSWDRDAVRKLGETLGDECLHERLAVLLGPGINIKRSPLCGRNFEYYSEDPVLAGEMAAGYINGVQSKNVGTSLKHFAANSTETRRMLADSIVDERALREIYLRGFEIAVRKAQPWTIMAAYNKINGKYCTENSYLLSDILRGEWGFQGLVVSDWNAISDREDALNAGVDLEMPSTGYYSINRLAKAYRNGKIDAETVETSAKRVLDLADKSLPNMKAAAPDFDMDEHHQIARELAVGCPVLLKNGGNVLPLNSADKVAVIGARAKDPVYQGAGSAKVNAHTVDTPYDFLERELSGMTYAAGYDIKHVDSPDAELTAEAVAVATAADKVLLFVSCRPEDVCEGADRKDMTLPAAMNQAVIDICKANPNTAVILTTGSAMELPWVDLPDTILQTYLLGEVYGSALSDILMGRVSPSGKLPESYPKSIQDTPCLADYQPDKNSNLIYKESIFVGYRYYETSGTEVTYPFGHGLSYTTFEYSDPVLTTKTLDTSKEDAKVVLKFNLTNTGSYDGAEVAQIYVAANFASLVYRPAKELKNFVKVFLKAGETKTVEVELDRHAFEYFSTELDAWAVEPGAYRILVGSSSEDIRLSQDLDVASADDLDYEIDYRSATPNYYAANIKAVDEDEFLDVLGYDLNDYLPDPSEKRVTPYDCIEDCTNSDHGWKVINLLNTVFDLAPVTEDLRAMAKESVLGAPFKRMTTASGGLISDTMLDGIVHYLNDGSLGQAIQLIARGVPETAKVVLIPKIKDMLNKKDVLE